MFIEIIVILQSLKTFQKVGKYAVFVKFKGRFSMVCAFFAQGKSVDEIARLTGSKPATITKYIDSYNAGKKKKIESFARKLSGNFGFL